MNAAIPRWNQPIRIKIAELLYEQAILDYRDIVSHLKCKTISGAEIELNFEMMIDNNQIIRTDRGYIISTAVFGFIRERISKMGQPTPQNTPSREPPTFRAISAKHIPSAKGTRPDAPQREDHAFITIGGSIAAPFNRED